MLLRRLELTADRLHVRHEQAIGAAGNHVGVEDGRWNLPWPGPADRDAGRVAAQSENRGGLALAEDLAHQVARLPVTAREAEQSADAARQGNNGLSDEFKAGRLENDGIDRALRTKE